MTTSLLIIMALLLIAALERTNRRQRPHPPGLHGTYDHNDRDWARTKLDLLALGGQSELEHESSPRFWRRLKGERPKIQTRRPAGSGQRMAGINSD